MAYQIGQNRQIRQEEAHAQWSNLVDQLKNLQWQEGGGDERGEIFGPNLLQHQPDAFKQPQRRVAEEEEADAAQHVVIDEAGLVNEEADQTALGVSVQGLNNVGDDFGDVFMEELASTDTNAHQQDGLEQFISGDEFQPPVTPFPCSDQWDPPFAPEAL